MNVSILLGFNLHRWLLDFGLYRDLVYSNWFSPIRPTWIEYHLAWVPVCILAVMLLLILRSVLRSLGRAREQSLLSPRAVRSRESKLAAEFLRQGDLIQAAESYERAEKFDKALALYEQEQRWSAAARLAEQLEMYEKAVELFDKARDSNGAVRVLCKLGRHLDGARKCRQDGRVLDGAQLLLDAGFKDQAALFYSEAGLFAKSARVYQELGDREKQVEALLNLIHQGHAGFTEDEAQQLTEGAAALNKMGRLSDSAEMLEAAGQVQGAALRFEEAGDTEAAVRCYTKAGLYRRALRICEEPLQRLELLRRARAAGEEVKESELAEARQLAGAPLGSGQDWIAEDPAERATRLAQEGKYAEAAEAYREAGELEFAREQFERAGDLASAAAVAEQAGNLFAAGRAFFESGKWKQAIDRLQRVSPKHVEARQVASMLARSFQALGDDEMAGRMHEKATTHLDMSRDNLELFYHQACFLEKRGTLEGERARAIFGKMLEVHYDFADVKARYDALKES